MENNVKIKPIVLQTGHRLYFNIGQVVYLKTDKEQIDRIVTGIMLRPNRSVTYCLSLGAIESWHYALEIDDEKDIVKTTT